MAKRITDFNVQDGATAVIKGKVTFSVLSKANVDDGGGHSQFPDTKPSYRATVKVESKDDLKPGEDNQNSKNFVEFLKSRVFTRKNGDYAITAKKIALGNKIDPATNKPFELDGPVVIDDVHDPKTAQPSQKVFANELAQGQEIMLGVRAVIPQSGNGFWTIVFVHVPNIDEVKYFGGSNNPLAGFDIAGFGLDAGKGGAPMTPKENPAASSAAAADQGSADNGNPFAGFGGSQPAQPNNQSDDGNPFTNTDTTGQDSPF